MNKKNYKKSWDPVEKPKPLEVKIIPPLPQAKTPVIREVKTYHPRFGWLKRKVIE